MKRQTVFALIHAALFAGLLAVWSPFDVGSFPVPGSPPFWEIIFGHNILPSPDDGYFLDHAWALGPFILTINSLTWLPFTLAFLHFLGKKQILFQGFGIVTLLGGILYMVSGVWEGARFLRYGFVEGIPVAKNYILFFYSLPCVLLGALCLPASRWILKSQLSRS